MLRVIIVFGLLAVVGGIATWRPDLAEKAYVQAQALLQTTYRRSRRRSRPGRAAAPPARRPSP